MATAVHNNSMKSLSNGSVNHVKEEVVDSSPERSPSSRNGDIDPFEVRVAKEEDTEPTAEEKKPLDIYINNVVCTFSVRCHLNLRDIALNGSNVEYRRENGVSCLFGKLGNSLNLVLALESRDEIKDQIISSLDPKANARFKLLI